MGWEGVPLALSRGLRGWTARRVESRVAVSRVGRVHEGRARLQECAGRGRRGTRARLRPTRPGAHRVEEKEERQRRPASHLPGRGRASTSGRPGVGDPLAANGTPGQPGEGGGQGAGSRKGWLCAAAWRPLTSATGPLSAAARVLQRLPVQALDAMLRARPPRAPSPAPPAATAPRPGPDAPRTPTATAAGLGPLPRASTDPNPGPTPCARRPPSPPHRPRAPRPRDTCRVTALGGKVQRRTRKRRERENREKGRVRLHLLTSKLFGRTTSQSRRYNRGRSDTSRIPLRTQGVYEVKLERTKP